MIHFGETLRLLMASKGLKPQELADAASVHRNTVDGMFDRKLMGQSVKLDRVLAVLGVSVDDFCRRAAVEWNEKAEGELRLDILNGLMALDRHALSMIYAAVQNESRASPESKDDAA